MLPWQTNNTFIIVSNSFFRWSCTDCTTGKLVFPLSDIPEMRKGAAAESAAAPLTAGKGGAHAPSILSPDWFAWLG